MVKCNNEQCGQPASVSGDGRIDQLPDERMENIDYVDVFEPRHVRPSPRLIAVPRRCPDAVEKELDAAFIASWGDFPAAANRIRAAVELILDDLKVRKTTTGRGKTRVRLTLHSRIEAVEKKYPAVHQALMAIKWLGNAGSHPGALDRDGVFDALDILESVLDELYSDHPKAIKKLIAAVNRRKGALIKKLPRRVR